jgi:hypothetical protein
MNDCLFPFIGETDILLSLFHLKRTNRAHCIFKKEEDIFLGEMNRPGHIFLP